MKRLLTFISAASARLHDSAALRLAYYALTAALLVLVYLVSDGQEVGFVYNEF